MTADQIIENENNFTADGDSPEATVDEAAEGEAAVDETAEGEAAVDETAENEAAVDETAEDEAVVDETAEHETPGYEAVEDEASEYKVIEVEDRVEEDTSDKTIGEGSEISSAEEEAARLAAEEKAARKAVKKAAKKLKAYEEAVQWVAGAINVLGGKVRPEDEEALTAMREAYDSMSYDQKELIPDGLLGMLSDAEQMIEEASKVFPISEAAVTVKDVTYTGRKIKKPSVKIKYGSTKLEEGEDYTFNYDKKIRDIGVYKLKIKGKGKFTGSAEVPFYVVPKVKTLIKLLEDDKEDALFWKSLKDLTGCQIEYSQDKDFADSRKEKIRKYKELNKLANKLKSGKKYYIRVRIYATVMDKKYYSDWSKTMTIKP